MPKYNGNAGFNGYEKQINDGYEQEISVEKSGTSKKTLLIIGVAVAAAIIIAVVAVMLLSGNNNTDEGATSTDATVATLNYEDVFGSTEPETTDSKAKSNAGSAGLITQAPMTGPLEDEEETEEENNDDKEKEAENANKDDNKQKNNDSGGSAKSNSNNSGGGGHSSSKSNSGNNSNSGKGSRQYNNDDDTVSVAYVNISESSIRLTEGSSHTLYASVSPSNASNTSITWSSTNNSVASVRGGKVYAESAGSCNIVASSHNGKKASCSVTVNEKQSHSEKDTCRITPNSKTIKVGETVKIILQGADKCSWNISNTFVVTDRGRRTNYIFVQGKKRGITNVIAYYNGKEYKCKITVE